MFTRIYDSLFPLGGGLLMVIDLILIRLFPGEKSFSRIVRFDLPEDKTGLPTLLDAADTAEFGWVDERGVYMLITSHTTGWMSVLGRFGFSFWFSEKLAKRAKILSRPSALQGFMSNIRIKQVRWDYALDPAHMPKSQLKSDKAYQKAIKRYAKTLKVFTDALVTDPDAHAKTLDGGLVIRRSIVERLFQSTADDTRAWVKTHMDEKILRATLLNGRVTGEFGMLKGQFCIVDDDVFDAIHGRDYDVVVLKGEIKQEINLDSIVHLLFDPQEGHWKETLNTQLFFNLMGALWDVPTALGWVEDQLDRAKERLQAGQVLEGVAALIRKDTAMKRTLSHGEEAAHTVQPWVAAELAASMHPEKNGWKVTHLPGLTMGIARTFARSIYRPEDRKQRVRVEIPGAGHFQVVTESFARMCGVYLHIEAGEMRFSTKLQAHVVTDIDFLQNYANHGGPDLDDFYTLIYRIIGGMKCIVVVRAPNSYGEYSIYKYVDGDMVPPSVERDGWITLSEAAVFPMQLGTAIETGRVSYSGLPSQNTKAAKAAKRLHTLADFKDQILASVGGMSGSAGQFVNVHLWWALTFGDFVPNQICSMEDAIDAFTQGGSQADRQAIQAWCLDTVELGVKMLSDTGSATDTMFWKGRGMKGMLADPFTHVDLAPMAFTLLVEGTQAILHDFSSSSHAPGECKHCQKAGHAATNGDQYWSWSVAFSQANANLPEGLEALVKASGTLGNWGGKSGAGAPSTGACQILRNYRAEWGAMMENSKNRQDELLAELEMDLELEEMLDSESKRAHSLRRDIKNLKSKAATVPQDEVGMLIRQTQVPPTGSTAAQTVAGIKGRNFITRGIMARRWGYNSMKLERVHSTHEQYWTVLALLVASYGYKNGKGLIDESIVTSAGLEYPRDEQGNLMPAITVTNSTLLMEALRHYRFISEPDGEYLAPEWDIECNTCGEEFHLTNAVSLARAEMNGMTCGTCVAKLDDGERANVVCVHCDKVVTVGKESFFKAKAAGFLCGDCRDPENLPS